MLVSVVVGPISIARNTIECLVLSTHYFSSISLLHNLFLFRFVTFTYGLLRRKLCLLDVSYLYVSWKKKTYVQQKSSWIGR